MTKKSHISLEKLRSAIRDVPDFPKPGIIYKDITPILQDGELFRAVIDNLLDSVSSLTFDKIVAIESRGFLFGAAMAYERGVGLVIVRKPKKLPYQTARVEYDLEYGTDSLEVHVDSVGKGERVLIVDDILATGGTARATVQLVSEIGGTVAGVAFFAELSFLKGREKLNDLNVKPLLSL